MSKFIFFGFMVARNFSFALIGLMVPCFADPQLAPWAGFLCRLAAVDVSAGRKYSEQLAKIKWEATVA